MNVKKEMESEEEDDDWPCIGNGLEEELIDDPVIESEVEEDPLQLKMDIKKEELNEEYEDFPKENCHSTQQRDLEERVIKNKEDDESCGSEGKAGNEEEFIDEPVMIDFDEDPLEVKIDFKKEETYKEFEVSGVDVLGKDIVEESDTACDVSKSNVISNCERNIDNAKEKKGRTSVNDDAKKMLSPVKEFICNYCCKSFSISKYFKKHLRIHTGEKRFSCEFCSKAFSTPASLRHHLRTHTGEKPFSCHLCGKSFSHSSTLKNHFNTHSGEKSFSCQYCNKLFSRSSYLKSHLRIHTGEKLLSCNCCNKMFSMPSNLRDHLRSHTGEKPFSCRICKKSFSYSSTLKNHIRVHTGEKQFSCHICKKSFSHSSTLKNHVRSHTGEKQFSCHFCEKSFTRSSILKRHLRIHTDENLFACP